jgi:hypothetical protein
VLDLDKDRARFQTARLGDYFMTAFQCDSCHFRNVYRRDPEPGNQAHQMGLKCIRRANLDAMWCRETSTVEGNFYAVRKMVQKANMLGVPCHLMLPRMGPWPVEDVQGMGIAMCVLMRTLDAGINEATVQFHTARKFRSAYSNLWRASLEGNQDAVAVRDLTKLIHTSCPTNKGWYERFDHGLHSRMGDKTKADMAVSIGVIHELMRMFDAEWDECNASWESQERHDILFPALFSVISFCASLRGEETPLMDLAGTLKHIAEGRDIPDVSLKHITVPLLGRFKTESGEHYHLIPIVWKTSSGLEPGKWYERMVDWYRLKATTQGPVFRKKDGARILTSEYEYIILSKFEEIQAARPDLISASIDVFDAYGLRRSFRRGSDTEALNQEVDTLDIHFMNRWRIMEKAKGKKPMLRMISSYAEMRLLLKTLLRYSRAL